ncbi:PQQ-binding-like beta-propeller repeat protein [Micromonospora krabiensis]|uniref:PQQ-like domain-containing protein n=1 Tax=Micromonospora krabiensis TaxID=307121 RepID=A0A1C3N3M4_9ACTN|nr:PQQ-binding-like beta-propeller repeat protein [Micromonospora krabiensis]SBV27165.1 PQQ-like domain-containing protein [Micromonospora krabiensis]
MTLIDLGELRADPVPVPVPRRRPPLGRPLRTLLVCVVALATLAGAAPAPGRVRAVVPGAPAAEPFLVGDLLLIARPVEGVTDGSRDLVAYPLPERAATTAQRPAPRWRVRLPVVGELWGVAAAGDALVLSANLAPDGAPDTIVLDAATGRLRWRQPGFSRLDASGRLLLERPVGPPTVSAVDLASGRTIWSTPGSFPPGAQYRVRNGTIDRVLMLGYDGTAELRDAATGAVLRRAAVTRAAATPEPPRHQVVGDLLLVLDGGVLRAYDLDRLEPRWSVEAPQVSYVLPCGVVLCAHTQPGGFRALDPATGATRWTAPAWSGVLASGAGRVLVTAGQSAGDDYAALDAGTGAVVAEWGTWQPLPAFEQDAPPVSLRRADDGRLVVVEWDLAAGRPRLLDVIADASGACQAGKDAMVCRRRDGSFGVWRWRR